MYSLVCVFLAILLLPLYAGIAQAVNVTGSRKLVDSLVVVNKRSERSANVFGAGETLVVAVESSRADSYSLKVYDGSSLVLVSDGEFYRGGAEVEVVLVPPEFSAGRVYLACFEAFSYDDPIPGAFSSDSVVSSFSVAGVETELSLTVEYDAAIGDLCLAAYLETVNGDDVEFVFVHFLLQSADEAEVTEGWVPITSVKSDYTGWARTDAAFSLPSGNYRVKAVFEGNADYGRSENVTEISIASSNVGASGDGDMQADCVPISSFGNLSVVASTSAPYALVQMNVEASYLDDELLVGQTWIVFFLDYLRGRGFLSALLARNGSGGGGGGGGGGGMWEEPYSVHDPVVVETEEATASAGTWWYRYAGTLLWAPQTLGGHTIIVGVFNGASSDLASAIQFGTGFLAVNTTVVDVQLCPANIVLDFPSAFYGDVFSVEAVISKPRPYGACVDDFFTTASLAPRFFYGSVEYVVDDVIESVPLEFYLNDSLASVGTTDQNGLCSIVLNPNFASVDVRVVFDDSPLYRETVTEKTLTLSEICAYSMRNPVNDDFGFNFTVNGAVGHDNFYVGVDSQLRAEVSLLNRSVWNLPLSIVYAKSLGNEAAQFANVSIPATSDYLRIGECCVAPDDTLVYDNYYVSEDVFLVFDSGQVVQPDSRGFACIPSGATRVTACNASVTDRLEFFRIGLNTTLSTDDFGEVLEVLSHVETGRYLVQLELFESPFFLTVVNGNSGVVSVGAEMNLVGFVNAVERPVHLSLSHQPDNVTVGSSVELIVDAVDGVLSESCSALPIQFFVNDVPLDTAYTNSTGTAVLSWTPTSNIVYDVVANYSGNAVYRPSNASYQFDLRYATDLELWLWPRPSDTYLHHVISDNETLDVNTFVDYRFKVMYLPPPSASLGEQVCVYVDDIFYTAVDISPLGPSAMFSWSTNSSGIHYINVTYDGDENYKPDYVFFAAKAKASPVSLNFDVSPAAFEAGTSVNLWAMAINPLTGQPLSNLKIEFWEYGSGSGSLVNGEDYYITDGNGVATTSWQYPDNGTVFAVVARVKSGQALANVTLATRPVTLNVGVETKLWLWVERGSTDTDHTVYARLARASDPECGVANQTLKLDVNGTGYALRTGSDGRATQPLNLVAVGTKSTMYQISAVFEGAGFKTKNLIVTDPYGHDYVVCTTMQWDFKSSQNCVTLMVEAPKTDATVSEPASPDDEVTVTQDDDSTTVTIPPEKTPEQIRQEAEENGSMKPPEARFTWGAPWFRLHFVYSYNGEDILDVGIAPLGNDIVNPSPRFDSWIDNFVKAVARSYAIGMIAAEIAVFVAMQFGPQAFAIALLASVIVKGILLVSAWNSAQALQSSFVGTFISLILGVVGAVRMIDSALLSLASSFLTAASSTNWWKFLYKLIYIPINLAFMLVILSRLNELAVT